MSTKSKANRAQQQAADQALIAGLAKHSSTVPSLVIGGTSFTTAAIIGLLQARLATGSAVLTTRASWESAVQTDRDERTKTQQFVSGVRQAVQVAFAGSIDQLADFGLKPRKVTTRTPDEKAAAVAKAKATRAARHTMGPKQKAAIKGTVPATAPATPPAAPAPTATPAAPPAATATPTAPVTPATPAKS